MLQNIFCFFCTAKHFGFVKCRVVLWCGRCSWLTSWNLVAD